MSQTHFSARLAVLGLLSFTASFVATAHAEQAPATRPAATTQEIDTPKQAAHQPTPSKFLRFFDTPSAETLRTSIVHFKDANGRRVDLIGAVHVADDNYYQTLNRRFQQYDHVLYEMVTHEPEPGAATGPTDKTAGDGNGGAATRPSTRPAPEPPTFEARMIGTLQRGMQKALNLTYQLDEVDYKAANLVHADMTWEQFSALQEERGEGFGQMMLASARAEAARPKAEQAKQPSFFELLAAFGAPDRARRLKLIVGRQFADMERMTATLAGPKGSVILTERNATAFKVLDQQLEAGDKHLAIFYGAAHLPGMEKLLEDRGFKQVGEPEWLVAWDISNVTE